MALLGFEDYDRFASISQLLNEQNWSQNNSSINTAQARTGRASLNVGAFGGSIQRLLPGVSGSVRIFGTGVYLSGSSDGTLIGMRSISTGRNGLRVRIEGSNQIAVYRDTTLLWASPTGEPVGTWLHFELKSDGKADATGSWSLRRNGQAMQSQAGVQTLVNGADVINAWQAVGSGGAGNPTYNYDDTYWLDGSGSDLNDFLGPVRARYQPPTANDTVDFTPSAGTNWQNVDDITANDDTDYNTAGFASLPDTDLFTAAALPPEASLIRAVKCIHRARKEAAATVETRNVIKSGASEAVGATWAIDTAYGEYIDIFTVDPATGAAFTPAGVNALRRGYRRVT